MGLRIQTNVAAMNAHRQLSISDAKMAKSLERLSSGYRINRAADDAAGLAIAGKLRINNRSYVKASENTLQATAMVQVAEGAMDQIENIINRLKELATQSASSTTDTDGRESLNSEFTTLVEEIDRIANSTKYGGTNLIKGTFGAEVVHAAETVEVGSVRRRQIQVRTSGQERGVDTRGLPGCSETVRGKEQVETVDRFAHRGPPGQRDRAARPGFRLHRERRAGDGCIQHRHHGRRPGAFAAPGERGGLQDVAALEQIDGDRECAG